MPKPEPKPEPIHSDERTLVAGEPLGVPLSAGLDVSDDERLRRRRARFGEVTAVPPSCEAGSTATASPTHVPSGACHASAAGGPPPPPRPALPPPVPCTRGTPWGNCFVGARAGRLSAVERDAVCDAHQALLSELLAGRVPTLPELHSLAGSFGVRVAAGTPPDYSSVLLAQLEEHRGTAPNFECSPACMAGARCHRSGLLRALVTLAGAVPAASVTLPAPPVVACCSSPPPPAATLLVPVRVAGAELVLLPRASGSLFGESLPSNEDSRDVAVASATPTAVRLLGEDCPWYAFLAGEWVESGITWRVILCLVGGPLRADMALACEAGTSPCSACDMAVWSRTDRLAPSRNGEVAKAVLARALVFVRPGPLSDPRLHVGRGGERWADESLEASEASPRSADLTALARVDQAHAEVQSFLSSEAARLRADGDMQRADFFEACASRVEPVPARELPAGLSGSDLSQADLAALDLTPFRRDTAIYPSVPPPPPSRPTCFPPDVPTPTCHASFLLDEVMSAALEWHADGDRWHRERLAGRSSTRPQGIAWGLDACRPEWRPFFAAGGVVLFDEHTGVPSCLSDANYPLSHGLDGRFASSEFKMLLDKEIVSYFGNGACLKAQGLPFLQLASNLESLYEADDATGVRRIAEELHKFGTFDETGWYLRAPRPSRATGTLGTAVLPSSGSPVGAVLKADGGTRIVIDMGFGYGELCLRKVSVSPLPPDSSWLGGEHAPTSPRPHYSTITTGGGGGLAMPVNVATGPTKPLHGEAYVAGGRWPWPYEGKSSVAEQSHNDLVLSVPAALGGLFIVHLMWDEWKSFHQTNYNMWELIATSNTVPLLDGSGNVADELRGITNARMAMGGAFASGINQRKGNACDWAIMRRFDAKQEARRRSEPESPEVSQWLERRAALPHDDYGTQARLAFGGFYSDDPKFSCCGPPSRVGDLAHSFYEVMGPGGLRYKLADRAKWLIAGWAAWQGIRMSAMLGLIWLPPRKAMHADQDLRRYSSGLMTGSEFTKMMGFLNYVGQLLHVHGNLNRLLWDSYDTHKANCEADGRSVGVTAMQPGPAQIQPVRVWRTVVMNTPGTTLLRVMRRAPPPRDCVTLWEIGSDACMDVTRIDGVTVAKQGNVPGTHDWPGMGGFLHGLLWQYVFSPEEIALVTIPVAEFIAGVVGLMVYDHEGVLEYAQRIALGIDAEATPRCALQGEAHRSGLLVAHDEFRKLPVYSKYRSRLTGKHVFGKANDPADAASRSRRAEAERLTRFLGLEPRWCPLPPEALSYVRAVVLRLREMRAKAVPRTCDPAVAGGTAPRFGDSPRPTLARRAPPSPSLMALRPPRGDGSPLLPKKIKGRHNVVTPDGHFGVDAPPALAAGAGASPRVTRNTSRLHSSPVSPLDHRGRAPHGATPVGLLFSAAAALVGPSAFPAPAASAVATEGTTSFVIAQRVDQLMAENARSCKPHRFRGDPAQLRGLIEAQVRAQARSANESSLAAEQSHLRLYWQPYCDLQHTPYTRPDVGSLSFEERQLEEAWWGGAIPWIQPRMPNGEGVMGRALPSSILKVLRNIRRAHKRQGIETVSLRSAVQATDGLLKDFMLEHGPLALVPKRKEPLLNEEIADILNFSGYVGDRRKRHLFDWASADYSSLLAMFHTLAQTGMRKAEVSLPPKAAFDKSRLSMLNVRWRIGGAIHNFLTPELYKQLTQHGGYALLRPPPSKADPFSLHWGPCTVYLRYSASEPINAARELAREEMRRKVDPDKREEAPLFVTGTGVAWRHAELALIFHSLIVAVRGEDRARQVSMHSWRVYLACALLASGASFATIQTMLRWRSEDALRIYACINDFKYADWLTSAQGATVSSVRTTTSAVDALSRAPEPGTLAGAMRDAAASAASVPASSDAAAAPAAVGTAAATSAPLVPAVGMRVAGYFPPGEGIPGSWDPGTISRVGGSGSFDVTYDDGTLCETGVTFGDNLRPLASTGSAGGAELASLAHAMRAAAHVDAAGSAEAGFHDEWRRLAASAIDTAVMAARSLDEQPEVDAYGRLEGLVGSVSSLMLEAERADADDGV